MMNYQPFTRNQRQKGLKVKQALQFTLLLAICIWLLYQIKHSEREKSGTSTASKISEEGAIIFGRKGLAGWLNHTDDSDSDSYSKHVNLMGQSNEKEEKKVQGKDDADEEEVEDETGMKMISSGGVVNTTVSGKSGFVKEVISFHDENGVPLGPKDEPIWTKSSDNRRSSYDASNSKNESK